MKKYLSEKLVTTRAGFFASCACGASASSFLIMFLKITDIKELFFLGFAYLALAWVLSKIDYEQRIKNLIKDPLSILEDA